MIAYLLNLPRVEVQVEQVAGVLVAEAEVVPVLVVIVVVIVAVVLTAEQEEPRDAPHALVWHGFHQPGFFTLALNDIQYGNIALQIPSASDCYINNLQAGRFCNRAERAPLPVLP